MSGSPVIQDGKLVGAITHVFVNDPTRGYGIFIENMLSESDKIKYEKEKIHLMRGEVYSLDGKSSLYLAEQVRTTKNIGQKAKIGGKRSYRANKNITTQKTIL